MGDAHVSRNQTYFEGRGRPSGILIRKLTALTAVMSLGAGSDSARLSLWNKMIELAIYYVGDIRASAAGIIKANVWKVPF